MNRIVLAYSGGLDTSVALLWLADRYRAEIVTVTMDLGQGRELDAVRDRALALGAARAHVLDLREEFADSFILPALQAGAMHDGRCSLGTALGRPLIAKHAVTIARIEGATTIAHGSSVTGHDQARFESAVRALDPSIKVMAPARVWGFTRAEEIDYARERGIPVPADSPFRAHTNLWGRAIECSRPEECWEEPAEDWYLLTKSSADAPDTPAYVDIEFAQGIPVKANGVHMPLVELISSLETIAGAHGIGRGDIVLTHMGGAATREVFEAPAAIALHTAHRELQSLVTPRDLDRLTCELGVRYADLIDDGRWYTPTRDAIDALVRKVQETVTGTVRLKFFKGDCRVVGRTISGGSPDVNINTSGARAVAHAGGRT